jgi:hypothetical protein
MEGVRAEALGQTKLALDDLVNQLYAGQDPPSVETKALPVCCRVTVGSISTPPKQSTSTINSVP